VRDERISTDNFDKEKRNQSSLKRGKKRRKKHVMCHTFAKMYVFKT
jgi:hypothetical protein